MKQWSCSCMLWLGLLQATFSHEQENKPRKLCGRHLMEEIIKLCGQSDWSHAEMEDDQLSPQSSKVKIFSPDQIPSSAWGRFTNPVAASSYQEKAVNTWENQPLRNYQFEKANFLPEKTEFARRDVNSYVETVNLHKKSTNKINIFSSLFGGNHSHRKRRGFSDKCCLKGCTKEELSLACLPYVLKLK